MIKSTTNNQRICASIEFHFDPKGAMILCVNASINDEVIPLSLGPMMQFLYKNDATLHKDDIDFGYLLSKVIKKHDLNQTLLFGISKDYDMYLFLDFCIKKQIHLFWTHNGRNVPITFLEALPISISIEKKGRSVVATLLNHNDWLNSPTTWLLFEMERKTLCFSQGVIRPISSLMLIFMDNFFEKESVTIPDDEIPGFLREVYKPHKNLINWNCTVDFSDFLPQEKDPIPILELTYKTHILQPMLSFKYGTEHITPEHVAEVVHEKQTGKKYARNKDLELIFQQDLMTLFTEQDLPFLLNSPGDIASFMENILPALTDRGWEIESSVPEFNVMKEPITLEFNCTSSGKDWFHFEPSCSILGQNMSLQEIAALMVENQGYIKTKSGFVKLEAKSQEELTALAKQGAFQTGKLFSKKEILPLMYATNTAGSDANTREFVEDLQSAKRGDTIELSDAFKGTLRDYQEHGVKWMHYLNKINCGGILADDMGLGKTVQTLALTTTLQSKKPVLIVGPTNVIYNWESEINKFIPGSSIVLYNGQNREKKCLAIPGANFVITSFGVMKNDIDWLQSIEFSALFVDEAQYLKNPTTQISKAIRFIKSDFKLAMTGTPIENHLIDLWSIIDFVMPGYLGTKREFEAYMGDNLDVLKTKIKPFILRREKREVLTSLPDKTEMIIKCDLTPEQSSLYKTILDATKRGIKSSTGKDKKMHILTSLLRLRQVCTHPGLLPELKSTSIPSAKFDVLKDKLLECMDGGHKVVLFSQFTGMLNILKSWTEDEGIYTERIDGTVTGKKRQEAVERFQTSEKAAIFLISLKAGGVGINLTAAEYVIHVDPWWNPAAEAQATDRVHRMGQKNKVFVYKLIAKGTIEDKIHELQEEKKQLLSSLVDIDSSLENNINMEEVSSILMDL
jgi:superfamily II DNA or RNA helicase